VAASLYEVVNKNISFEYGLVQENTQSDLKILIELFSYSVFIKGYYDQCLTNSYFMDDMCWGLFISAFIYLLHLVVSSHILSQCLI